MIDGGLRKLFRDRLRDAQWTSIESGMTGAGIPDGEYCFPGGISGWVEYKKTNGDAIHHMKPEQIGWLERRRRLGGRAFVAVRLVMERKGIDDLIVFDGAAARIIKTSGMSSVPEDLMRGRFSGGPANWDWAAVKAILTA